MIKNNIKKIDQNFQISLKENIPLEFFNNYLKNKIKIKEITNNIVFIIIKSKFVKQIIETTYDEQFKQIIKEVTQSNFKIVFLTEQEWSNRSEAIIKKNVFTTDTGLKDRFTFANYVNGNFNRGAYQAAILVSSNDSQESLYNPLFIYGKPGFGKTHLLKAIGNKCLSNYRDKNLKVKYIDSAKFSGELNNAFNVGFQGIENFKEKYFNYDVLLLDDVQFFSTMKKTKEIFFQIFNHFIQENKQIVIASDKVPGELGDFEDRYISRFQSGLTISIQNPSIEEASRIIKLKLANNSNLPAIEEDAILWISENFNSNIRNIEGAIKRIIFWSIQNNFIKDLISKKDVISALQEIADKSKIIEIDDVKKIVAKKYHTTVKKIISRQRQKVILEARQIAIFICRDLLNLTYKKIAKNFNRDHTTIMNSYKKINNRRNRDIKCKNKIKEIVDQLQNNLN